MSRKSTRQEDEELNLFADVSDGHNIYLRADSSLGQAAVSEVAASAANLQRSKEF